MGNLLQTLRYWLKGVRLYIGIGIVLVTLEVAWWGQTVFGGSSLATIRTQEVYAWLSLALLATALLIGPVTKAFSGLPGKQQWRDARRLIGIGAAWFALLHAAISYFGQFQGTNPLALPTTYKQALLLGTIGLIAFMPMVFTSFDAAFNAMGIWWFRLHRLIYIIALVVLLHTFMIGAHASNLLPLLLLGALAAVWVGLNLYFAIRGPQPRVRRIIVLSIGIILLLLIFGTGVQQHNNAGVLYNEHAGHGL